MTINNFFEIYNKYCDISNWKYQFHNEEKESQLCYREGISEFRIFQKDGSFFCITPTEKVHKYENESVCIYSLLENLKDILITVNFPKYNILLYGDVVVGIVINLSEGQKAYLADDIVIACKVSDLDNIQSLDEEFWSSCPKEMIKKVDKWVEERY